MLKISEIVITITVLIALNCLVALVFGRLI